VFNWKEKGVNKRTSTFRRSPLTSHTAGAGRKKTSPSNSSARKNGKLILVWILIVVNVVIIYSFLHNQILSPRTPRTGNEEAPDAISVRVQNGCGSKGVGNTFADILRKEHYRIVVVENADDYSYERSVIIDHDKADRDKVEKLTSVLGVSKDQLYHIDQRGVQADVTFIIGKDYPNLKSYKQTRD
jgi:hypothetical protein